MCPPLRESGGCVPKILYPAIHLHKDLRLTVVPTSPRYDPTANPSRLPRVHRRTKSRNARSSTPTRRWCVSPMPFFSSFFPPLSSLSLRWWISPMCARGSTGGGPLAHLPHARSAEGPPPSALPPAETRPCASRQAASRRTRPALVAGVPRSPPAACGLEAGGRGARAPPLQRPAGSDAAAGRAEMTTVNTTASTHAWIPSCYPPLSISRLLDLGAGKPCLRADQAADLARALVVSAGTGEESR